jgi:hypothetical protein
MLELAFTVCLLASPTHCEDRSLLFFDVSMMQCALGAQTVLAPWSEAHPRWRVDGYRCQHLDELGMEL